MGAKFVEALGYIMTTRIWVDSLGGDGFIPG